MKFSPDAKCEHCGARRNDGALRIDITGLGMAGQLSTYPIDIPAFYIVCKNSDCLAKDIDKMRDDLLSKFSNKKVVGGRKYPVDPNNPNRLLGHCNNSDCPTCGDFGFPRE